ncbi:transposable element Tcb1 transposase [Trichonephila clavipes]|uniref:Transposable element Tcb1 transposase n=1 Tax=Trichonephila clavipes TaxID=2585209 RepID=A0A8X6SXZ7_TRICX|nr:transposable element Tcb1 transposase [Trichonephila clavipes]
MSATPPWSESSLETPWRKDAEQMRYAPPNWSGKGYYGVGATHTVVLPYLQGLATTIFQQDNERPHVARIVQRSFDTPQIELLPRPASSSDLSPIDNMWSMVAQQLTQIIPPAATPNQLWQRVEADFGLLNP